MLKTLGFGFDCFLLGGGGYYCYDHLRHAKSLYSEENKVNHHVQQDLLSAFSFSLCALVGGMGILKYRHPMYEKIGRWAAYGTAAMLISGKAYNRR